MTYRQLSKQIKSNRSILALLRTRPDNLNPEKKAKRDAEYLRKNREAAAMSRRKRKQEQMQKSNLVSDLENQLSAVKAENCALQMENMSLRNEISLIDK